MGLNTSLGAFFFLFDKADNHPKGWDGKAVALLITKWPRLAKGESLVSLAFFIGNKSN